MVPSLAPAPPGHSRFLEPRAYNVVGAEEEGLPPGILGNTSWCHVTWRHPTPLQPPPQARHLGPSAADRPSTGCYPTRKSLSKSVITA